ncbi:transposase [Chlamydiota bacterium]
MPRDKRIDIPGAIHHVITRGLERRDIFLDAADRKEFLSRLELALEKTGCQCLSWALMSNHFHLLIRTGVKSLSDLMRKILTGHAIYFNRKYKRHGYLYQNRYKSVLCQEDAYLLQLVRYIHTNPIRAQIVKSLEELDEYPWTGHSAIVGKKKRKWQTIEDVLILFGSQRGEAVRNYRLFIEDAMYEGRREELSGGGLRRSAGGWEELKRMRRDKEYWRGHHRKLGEGDFVEKVLKTADEEMDRKFQLIREGWNLEKLVKRVSMKYDISEEAMRKQGRGDKLSEARSVLCAVGYNELGIKSRELAEYLGVSQAGVSQNIERGEKCLKEKTLNLLI